MTETSQSEWRDSPNEQGWWWWWNGDDDCCPVPVSIMGSGHGTNSVMFATVGQLGWTEPQFIEQDWSGHWSRLSERDIPAPGDLC